MSGSILLAAHHIAGTENDGENEDQSSDQLQREPPAGMRVEWSSE